jgi:predicted aminopeptidase
MTRGGARRRAPGRCVVLVVLLALGGCAQPGYLARLGWTEAKLLWRREPIPELLERRDLDPMLRERLELVLAARAFARDRLGFRVGDSYDSYVRVTKAEATVHVVSAAYRDRLELESWWYPVAGRVPYRGYFAAAAARREADRLQRRGFDVDVRPAVAFSTLGWFADPVLSTMADEGPVALVATVLHELFHQSLYVRGAPAFNESAATFAGERGAIAFFCTGPAMDATRCAEARAAWRRTRGRGRVLGRLADRLRRLYASRPARDVRERQRWALAAMAGRSLERQGLGTMADVYPPNNARLLGELLYLTRLDDFQALAPGEEDPGPALRRLMAAAQGSHDPFGVLDRLLGGGGQGKLQDGGPSP